jgi:hypothetical protein
MSVHEVICSNCGAINRGDSEPCWRCLEILPAAASADVAETAFVLDRTG